METSMVMNPKVRYSLSYLAAIDRFKFSKSLTTNQIKIFVFYCTESKYHSDNTPNNIQHITI